jgi:hypothetical protein
LVQSWAGGTLGWMSVGVGGMYEGPPVIISGGVAHSPDEGSQKAPKSPQVKTTCFQWHCPSSQLGSLYSIVSLPLTQTEGARPQSVAVVQAWVGGIVVARHVPALHGQPAGQGTRFICGGPSVFVPRSHVRTGATTTSPSHEDGP